MRFTNYLRVEYMPIETRCDGCGSILKIADQNVGRRARCPVCRTEYTVPESSDVVALDAVCHFCGAHLSPTELRAADGQFKTCDLCQQSIDENLEEIAEQFDKRATSVRLMARICAAFRR